MTEPDDVQLTADLRRLSRILHSTAGDIMVELASPERTLELAGLLEEAARSLRQRASAAAPPVVTMVKPLGLDPPAGPCSTSGP